MSEEWRSTSMAGFALVFSAAAWVHALNQSQRDLFLTLHERLNTPDLQAGRRTIWEEIHTEQDALDLRKSRPDEFRKVVNAISMFDVLGLYAKRKFVNKGLVLQEWGSPLARSYRSGIHVLNARERSLGWRPWPHFEWLGKKAEDWHRKKGRGYGVP